ncbi:COQ9 domain-containing protein [Hirsutella rhossiliensis]|uniref:Ubiquinone biosynthesis protein n=1 Tax=Hirsutella rhossiliensis TaxID=111463 RepID=A0A9P8MMP6_9HYPO|nr:COQ9 domain-containing protein [Hirsutella rhossiliensis]KAH0957970.1 COQ9 domain-containing protein [Hirsutella rhossiliensis]
MPPYPRQALVSSLALALRGPCLTRSCSQSFHSFHHPPSDGPFGAVEDAILAAAYRHVPEHGFSRRALGLGARDAGFLDISPSILPEGSFSLIRYHLVTRRRDLSRQDPAAGAASQDPAASGVAEKVTQLTWARLRANEAVIHQWQQALAIMAQPSYLPASLKELALLSDEIWFLAGDRAVDPSWYSKRASLSMIYSSAELLMTNDRSPGYAETRDFLHRRLAETRTAGSYVESLGQWAGFTVNASLNLLRSKGVPI